MSDLFRGTNSLTLYFESHFGLAGCGTDLVFARGTLWHVPTHR